MSRPVRSRLARAWLAWPNTDMPAVLWIALAFLRSTLVIVVLGGILYVAL